MDYFGIQYCHLNCEHYFTYVLQSPRFHHSLHLIHFKYYFILWILSDVKPIQRHWLHHDIFFLLTCASVFVNCCDRLYKFSPLSVFHSPCLISIQRYFFCIGKFQLELPVLVLFSQMDKGSTIACFLSHLTWNITHTNQFSCMMIIQCVRNFLYILEIKWSHGMGKYYPPTEMLPMDISESCSLYWLIYAYTYSRTGNILNNPIFVHFSYVS